MWILVKEVVFLLRIIFTDEVFIDPRKVEAVLKWEKPTNMMEIRRFIGLAWYYRTFIKVFFYYNYPINSADYEGNQIGIDEKVLRKLLEVKEKVNYRPCADTSLKN